MYWHVYGYGIWIQQQSIIVNEFEELEVKYLHTYLLDNNEIQIAPQLKSPFVFITIKGRF